MDIKDLSCLICLQPYDSNQHAPRILPACGHTVCTKCLGDILKTSTTAVCPFDNKTLGKKKKGLENFPKNYSLEALIEINASKSICSIHKEHITLICLVEGIKGCIECMADKKHKGHIIRPINKVKAEIEPKKMVEQIITVEKKKIEEKKNDKRYIEIEEEHPVKKVKIEESNKINANFLRVIL